MSDEEIGFRVASLKLLLLLWVFFLVIKEVLLRWKKRVIQKWGIRHPPRSLK